MKKYLLPVLLLVAVMLSGCIATKGTPPVLTFDGVEITVGESRPYDLTSQGFETSFPGNQMTIGEMPGKSWLSTFMVLKGEDGSSYAYLYIYNPDREKQSYGLSTIYKVQFDMHSEDSSYWAENNVLVNGINFFGMDSPAVKEAMSEYKLAHETDTGTLRYEDGNFKYFFFFHEETGVVEEVQVEMVIAKSYTNA